MFFIATMTLTPSRMARKLVANWFLRSKISRQTRVWSFMGGTDSYFLGAGQQPEPGAQLEDAFFSAAFRSAFEVAPSTLVTSIPGGASNAVLAVFALGSTFSWPTSFASLTSAGSTFTISARSEEHTSE